MTAGTWRDRAACRHEDPEIFFPISDTGPLPTDPHTGEDARMICARCDVRADCRTWATKHPDLSQHGIWGGLTADERHGGPSGTCRAGHPLTRETTQFRDEHGGRWVCKICATEQKRATKRRANYGHTVCPTCETSFKRRRKGQRYCSVTCSIRANQKPGGGRVPERK